ncbi:hypothetical protein D9M70_645820 [compost metagenome]
MSRESSFIDFGLAYGVRIECGKKAEEVIGVINNGLVQKEQVLVFITSPDGKAGTAFADFLYARQQLESF